MTEKHVSRTRKAATVQYLGVLYATGIREQPNLQANDHGCRRWKRRWKLHCRVDTDYCGIVMRDEAAQKKVFSSALQLSRMCRFHPHIHRLSVSKWQTYSTIYSTKRH